MKSNFFIRRAVFLTLSIVSAYALPSAAQVPATSVQDITYLVRGTGGRVSWLHANQTLLLDRQNERGFFRVWSANRDGGDLTCITCNSPLLPTRHHGNPAWHPSGEFFTLQVADPAIAGGLRDTTLHKLITSPGSGVQNNLWIMSRDGSTAIKVTSVKRSGGVLHPHFSPDGTKLLWAQRLNDNDGIGDWNMKLADVAIAGGAISVSNIRTLRPGRLGFYETHGFSPDSKTIIFTGMKTGAGTKGFDIYTYNLETRGLRLLTDARRKQWDEHAHFTADGSQIVWMSSMGIRQDINWFNEWRTKTDYWIMNADGSGKRRLTTFNQPGQRPRTIASDIDISSAGDGTFFGYIQDPGTSRRPGSVIRGRLE